MGPIILFILVSCSILFFSRYIPIGISAFAGAFIATILGFVSIQEVKDTLELVANPTITLVLIIMISLMLKKNGFFDFFAVKLIMYSKQNTYILFFLIILFGALLGSFFSTDGAVLILTPIVLSKFNYIKLPKSAILAFVMATGFIADTSSLTFTISNLTNILGAEYLPISFNAFFSIMWSTNCISVLISLIMLFLVYKKSLPKKIEFIKPIDVNSLIQDKMLFYLSCTLLTLLFIFFFVASTYLIPSSLIILPFALILLIATLYKKNIQVIELIKKTPFDIIIFSLGMYVLVYAIKSTPVFSASIELMQYFLDRGSRVFLFCNTIFVAINSCIFNNLSAYLFSLLYVDHLSLSESSKTLANLCSLIGANIGAKMSPIGSLATLLWLHILKQHKIHISWSYYIKMGLILTLPTLFITLGFFLYVKA